MKLTIRPGRPLRGEVSLHGDKSLSHRAALFAALAEGESRFRNFLVSGVTDVMLDSLSRLGVRWDLSGSDLKVEGRGLGGFRSPDKPLNCGNSATTLRLLAGALAASGTEAVLDGSPGLRRRPMGRIVEPLRAMGVPIEGAESGTAPLRLANRPLASRLRSMRHSLPVASAQVKSAILLAGLASDGPTSVREPGPSRDHTERMLTAMGVRVRRESDLEVTVYPPERPLEPLDVFIPGDFSASAFLVVAALVTPASEVTVRGVGLNPTRTGLVDALESMGADIRVDGEGERHNEPVGDLTARTSALRGIEVSGDLVVRMIDEFPALGVAAAFAEGETVVRDAEELRYKETDRISDLCAELRALGVEARERPDGLVIAGRRGVRGGEARSHGDHRLAMALSLAGLAAEHAVTVDGAEVFAESFPEFKETLATLGADVRLET